MQKKLTVTIDEEVYNLDQPHVVRPNLESAYVEMARDRRREKEALEWAEISDMS